MPILGVIASSTRQGQVVPDTGAMFPLGMVQVGSGGASTITFSSIPQTYKHLQVRYIAKNTVANYFVSAQFNSDTGTRYANHYLTGNGTSASATAATGDTRLYFPRTNTSNFSGGILDILDYTSTNKNKTTRSIGGFDANGSGNVDFNSGLWMPASLGSGNITRIDFLLDAGNYAQHTQFALYGIKQRSLMSTYTPIATQTLGSAAASVIFSSIPQGYTDIRVVVVTAVNTSTYMQFNSDSGSNYSLTEIWAGSSANSERATSITRMDLRNSNSTLGNNMATIDIMNYSNSTTNKTVLTAIRDGLYDRVYRQVQLWRNTASITTIRFFPDTGNFPIGSTFSIYGIQVGNAAQKAQGGNIVTSDGTYMYHAFTSSGSFIPNEALTADVLVVAGGGGGGHNTGGGGGAGGYRLLSSQSLTAKSYPVIVGAGGVGPSSGGIAGADGSNSLFGSISSTGGGGGAGSQTTVDGLGGRSGGSGGGASRGGINSQNGGAGNAGSYSPVEGYAGGNNGPGSPGGNSGGGGGAGAVGANAVAGQSGAGGAGSNSASSWLSATSLGVSGYVAGGGGGGAYSTAAGAGGSGGGGAGSMDSVAAAGNGVTNTGSGGGGANNNSTPSGVAGSGGSGIVIIRYAL